MKALVCRICALLAVVATAAQGQTVVAGQVVNRATRVPIPSVVVELLTPADSVLTTSTSGADGTFALEAPSAGTYRVRLTAPGSDSHVSDTLTVAAGDYFAREFAISPSPKAFLEFQVDRPVMPAKNQRHPPYPYDLRQSRISGCALVQFVVDETGTPDTTTFQALRASHMEFVHAVRNWLPSAQFVPAELGGRKVRQLVRQPFGFQISGVQRRVEVPITSSRGGSGGSQPTVPPPRMTVPPPPAPSMPELCRSMIP